MIIQLLGHHMNSSYLPLKPKIDSRDGMIYH